MGKGSGLYRLASGRVYRDDEEDLDDESKQIPSVPRGNVIALSRDNHA